MSKNEDPPVPEVICDVARRRPGHRNKGVGYGHGNGSSIGKGTVPRWGRSRMNDSPRPMRGHRFRMDRGRRRPSGGRIQFLIAGAAERGDESAMIDLRAMDVRG